MNKIFTFLFGMLMLFAVYANGAQDVVQQDTNEVIKLNKLGYASRFTSPEQTVKNANDALAMAKRIHYANGIAEAYRVRGIGEYRQGKSESAIESYLNALSAYQEAHNRLGEARVYNNMGNLYQEINYDRALEYFKKSLNLVGHISDKNIIASLYLNMGNVYYRKKSFYQALSYYNRSYPIFVGLDDKVNVAQCLQNLGVIYYNLKDYKRAKELLIKANSQAKVLDLNSVIASANLTLTSLYIAENDFSNAEKTLEEGKTYAELIKNEKHLYDYQFTSYELEFKRKNFERALFYLHNIYKQDSITYKSRTSVALNLTEVKHNQEVTQLETEKKLEREKNNRLMFWAATIVAGLLLVVIMLLVGNVKRKAVTNKRLTELNEEVSRQKDNLDRVNHHLEEIIDERTKDLQIKNKKLSEYSSYLSHQIRGPIATLKGLMNLENEGLVGKEECINMMNKCVSDIDEKIIDMSDMLHDPERTAFNKN